MVYESVMGERGMRRLRSNCETTLGDVAWMPCPVAEFDKY
jgi:hypothetical protein